MVAIRNGSAPDKKQGRLTGTLTVGDPRFESLVQGLGIEAHSIHEIRQFAKSLATDSRRFQNALKGGLFGSHRFTKRDAERAYRQAFGGEARL